MLSDLIVVAEHRQFTPSATYHLMCRLMLDRQVLWVDAAAFRQGGDRDTFAPATDVRAKGTRFRQMAPFPVISAEDLGAGDHPLSRLVSPRLLYRRVERAARAQGLRRPMLWLASPWAAPLVDFFPDSPVVYQTGQDKADAGTSDTAEVLARHQKLAASASLLLAPSRASCASLPADRTRVLSTAVDLDLFASPTQAARDLPCPGPVAGCHGCLDGEFDVDLLAGIARRRPDWQFMLLGPTARDLSVAQALPNVHLAGARSHDQLPRYLQYWQASLLLRPQGAAKLPAPSLPMLESLAAGAPVISAGPQNHGTFPDMIVQVRDADEAAQALSESVHESAQQRSLRLHRLVGESWTARAAQVSNLLARLELGDGARVAGAYADAR